MLKPASKTPDAHPIADKVQLDLYSVAKRWR